ncbi:transglutaminase domain-containing protein [Foetidibacter luteolus]|uniref:transglutaminase domain-containing protein n=1 Tax=Foetidibacter luteolus TaxID=2608880 RepID=UPI00129B5D45|nr:transglutaminase domain-containing protein [Foetidibacter luteolus]
MAKKRYAYWFLLALLLAANLYIILNRNNGYKYHPYKTYSELYVMDSSLYLHNLFFTNDSVELTFSVPLPVKQYRLTVDSGAAVLVTPRASSIVLPLQRRLHTYSLQPLGENCCSLPIQLKIDHDIHYSADSFYINELLYCNLPGPGIETSPLTLWQKGLQAYSKQAQQQGLQLLTAKTSIAHAATDLEKAKEIARLVASLPNNNAGTKPGEHYSATAWEQVQLSLQNKARLDCGNYNQITSFFCTLAGLPNRVVYYFGPDGNWKYGIHLLNEVYLREQQQWAVLDATFNIYLPHNGSRFYNIVDIKKMAQTNSLSGKWLFSYSADSLQLLPTDSALSGLMYYNQSNADLAFNYPGTNTYGNRLTFIANFYSFHNEVCFYSDVHRNYWGKIIVKMLAFYGWIILLVTYAFMEWKYYRKATAGK